MIRFALLAAVFLGTSSNVSADGKHLFILSGQSNMARFNEKVTFVPAIEAAFGKQNVICVKDAQGGKPIRCWYKAWTAPEGRRKKQEIGALYDRLMAKVRKATEGQEIQTVTVLWMQGEQDARESTGNLYRASLEGLIRQFESDLGRKDLNCVIGRLSDFGIGNRDWPHWDSIRKCQQEVAESSNRFTWVNTDDLNDGINKRGKFVENELHYTKKGYQVFGNRLAKAAISLITKEIAIPNDAPQR